MTRILLIGATGVFGSRLAAHLAREADLELLLGSRSAERAERLCHHLAKRAGTQAALRPVALDVSANIGARIAELSPRIVVDCSGPFQHSDFRVPTAALAAGAHFVDLADARDYLLGFAEALDETAKVSGLVALSGASSSPALGAAALAALTENWERVDHIAVAIVPGGRSEVGDAAVKAALSYCGRNVPVVAFGEVDRTFGWSGGERIHVPVLGSRAVAPVETADAELLLRQYRGAVSIRFRAGLESTLEHQGMRVLSILHRSGLLPRPKRLAGVLVPMRRLTRIMTGDRGGMLVRVSGLGEDHRWQEATWRLIARDNQGPHVPPAPAAAAVLAILRGEIQPGARVCLDLALDAIEWEFAPYAIETVRETHAAATSVTEVALGAAQSARLPPVLARFHALEGEPLWRGVADVEGAAHPLGRLIARAVGFPKSTQGIPVAVAVERHATSVGQPPDEVWKRRFGTRVFHSRFSLSKDGLATERFGPFRFRIGLTVDDAGRLAYPVAGWSLGWLPLPLWLAPRSDTLEWQDEGGRFRFDVRVSLPAHSSDRGHLFHAIVGACSRASWAAVP
jgi:saccharopine dehydrogenase-like NADP-dependent oxidoreductase